MVDEVITIPELQEALTAEAGDQAVIRQGGIDKRSTLAVLKAYFATAASLSTVGVVQLNNAVDSISTTEAATPNAVRLAYSTASTALNTANDALNGLSGKANLSHTHAASDVVSGVFAADRLPVSNLNSFGIARHTNSLANPSGDSANGYVPSLMLVNSLAIAITSINGTMATLASNGTYNRWDGGPAGLNVAEGRNSLGATTLGSNIFQMVNPGGVRYLRINADNTVTALDSNNFKLNLGIQGATDTISGLVERATAAEAVAGVDNLRFTTPAHLPKESTESVSGKVRRASEAEVVAGANDASYVSPLKLKFGFSVSLTQNGWVRLPSWMSGLEFRWGILTVPGNSFASTGGIFTNACLQGVCCLGSPTDVDRQAPNLVPSGRAVLLYNPDGGTTLPIRYFAVGY